MTRKLTLRTEALRDLRLLLGKEIEIRPDSTIQVTSLCGVYMKRATQAVGEGDYPMATGQTSQLCESYV